MLIRLLLLVPFAAPQGAALEAPAGRATRAQDPLVPQDLLAAARVAGLDFGPRELELMLEGVRANLAGYARLGGLSLPNDLAPAFRFDPLLPGLEARVVPIAAGELEFPPGRRPADLEELAFADIPSLAGLIRSREVSCVELAELFLARLRRLDETLHCVVTFTEARALERARALDRELEAGRWRGPLHGIPYGAKDLLAARGAPTTWGAAPFEEQVLDFDATVIARLEEAGAVLIAKLSLGALAMGDEWFAARTRNPWRIEQGSSGSSAGSAAATVAGGVPFAIGSETLGSIVSPSDRCGASSIRPTFGRVPRTGAMTLSWTMDKLGPMARSIRDAALVLEAIHGADGRDPDAITRPFAVPGTFDPVGLRIGVPAGLFEQNAPAHLRAVLEDLRGLGCELVAVDAPELPVWELMVILTAESAAAFEAFTRTGQDRGLVRQTAEAWPNLLRVARLVPAVEYLQASRVRTMLMRRVHELLGEVDLLVHPSREGPWLGITNLTGHPTVVVPAAARSDGTPTSVSFTGQLFDEARLVALASAWQHASGHHLRRPQVPPSSRSIELVVAEAVLDGWSEPVGGRPLAEVLEPGTTLTLAPRAVRCSPTSGGMARIEFDLEPADLAAARALHAGRAGRPLAVVVDGRVVGWIGDGWEPSAPLVLAGRPVAWMRP